MTETPKLLYHYTTAQGLLGILKSNVLWASNLLYMNDFSELKYSIELIKSELEKAFNVSNPNLKNSPFFPMILDILDATLSACNVYSTCFCEDGDQLSQWRSYSQKGTGYAIGFDLKHIDRASELLPLNSSLFLTDIVYEKEDQLKLLNPIINNYIHSVRSLILGRTSPTEDQIKKYATNFLINAFRCLFSFKHSAFQDEREWRIFQIMSSNSSSGKIEFREIGGTIVPYMEMSFP
jgi:hypothetical protein